MEGKIMLLQQAIAYISRKERGIWFSSDSPLDPFLLVFLFSLMQVGGRLRTISSSRLGPVLLWPVSRGCPFALKEAEKVQRAFWGWTHGSSIWKSRSAFLVKKRWRAAVGRAGWSGSGSQASAWRCFTQKTDQHLDFRSGSFQLVQGKPLSDKARGRSWSTKSWLRRTS